MLDGQLFIICGLSRLSARVARSLEAQNARVTVIVYDGDKPSLKMILPRSATILTATAESAASTLREAGIQDAQCLLALSEDDVSNLRSTVSARSIVPDIAVVMRAFDPLLADQFEKSFGVRRAFSVSALAAPAFAAAAAGGDMLCGLRIGSEVVPFCRLTLRKDSPIIGKTIKEIEEDHAVTIVAVEKNGGEWAQPVEPEQKRKEKLRERFTGGRHGAVHYADAEHNPNRFHAGDQILFAGAPQKALILLIHAAGWYRRKAAQAEASGRGSVASKPRPRVSGARRSLTWLPRLMVILVLFTIFATLVFKDTLHLNMIDSIYFVVSTMTTVGDSDISLSHAPGWLKLFHCVLMLNGGALLGVSFSYLASLATAERLEVIMARQAERMTGHVIVVGLGNVGYRVTESLTDLGLDMAVIDLAPPARFYDVLSRRAPVLVGDARLSDNLERLSIRDAEAIIACTSDDVANIETCLHARRMNPHIRTIARVFDDHIVETVGSAFSIDRILSATNFAQSAFVIAASDKDAVRAIEVGPLTIAAVRYRGRTRIVPADLLAWKKHGISVVAFQSVSGKVTSKITPETTYEVVACGAPDSIRALLAHQLIGAAR